MQDYLDVVAAHARDTRSQPGHRVVAATDPTAASSPRLDTDNSIANRRQQLAHPATSPCKRRCKRKRDSPELTLGTGLATHRPPLAKVDVEGSSPFTRSLRRTQGQRLGFLRLVRSEFGRGFRSTAVRIARARYGGWPQDAQDAPPTASASWTSGEASRERRAPARLRAFTNN